MSLDLVCAEASLSQGETLAGSAVAEVDHWILLRAPGPWGPSGLVDSGLDSRVVDRLAALSKRHPRLRVQLIRRPGDPPGLGSVLFARAAFSQSVASLSLPDAGALLGVNIEQWLAGGPIPGAESSSEPIYLVCVHGKRDRCCAERGMAVYTALNAAAGDRVFQTTHLGGHRFAATLTVLPHGIGYGRVAPGEAPALAQAHDQGLVFDLARMRGRSAYRASVQAAEIFLRQRLSERALSSLRFVRVEAAADGEKVVFRHLGTGQDHAVVVGRRELSAFPQSCGAAPKEATCFVERA